MRFPIQEIDIVTPTTSLIADFRRHTDIFPISPIAAAEQEKYLSELSTAAEETRLSALPKQAAASSRKPGRTSKAIRRPKLRDKETAKLPRLDFASTRKHRLRLPDGAGP